MEQPIDASGPVRRSNGKEQSILEATIEVFSKKGYHRSTIADIAREAGVAAGTIYLYFDRKESLLGAAFRHFVGNYLADTLPELDALPPGRPRLERFVEIYLHFFERDRRIAKVFLVHLREVDPQLREEISPTVRQYVEAVEEILASGVHGEHFAPDLHLRTARNLLFGSLDATVTAWVLSGGSYCLLELAEPLNRMLARAFGAAA